MLIKFNLVKIENGFVFKLIHIDDSCYRKAILCKTNNVSITFSRSWSSSNGRYIDNFKVAGLENGRTYYFNLVGLLNKVIVKEFDNNNERDIEFNLILSGLKIFSDKSNWVNL